MEKIDIASWERKSHFTWFSSFADPSVSMDVKMDITDLLAFCREKEYSSYAVLMYVICECINANPAFRLRMYNDDVWRIDKANVAYTIMVNDKDFMNCRASMQQGFADYLEQVEANRIKYTNSNFVQEEYNDTTIIDDIYCSCVPWVNFLSVRQPVPNNNPESQSIPRACWGKYVSEGDRWFCTLNITANHALIDGMDLSHVFNNIQDAFLHIEAFLACRT